MESGRTHDEGGSIFDAPECGSLWDAPFHAYDFIGDLETMLQDLEEEQKERMVVRARARVWCPCVCKYADAHACSSSHVDDNLPPPPSVRTARGPGRLSCAELSMHVSLC